MGIENVLSILLGINTLPNSQAISDANQENIARVQEQYAPFTLGTHETKENKKRLRKDIYTKWEQMMKFAPIAEGIGIHVSAALGGDATTSKQVFITPAQRLREGKGAAINAQLKQLEESIPSLENLINLHIVKIVRDGVGFGDSYVRVYGKKNVGVTDLVCNEFTHPPLIQSFEQGGRTVAFHALDTKNWQKTVSKFSTIQMLRLKMPRLSNVPQFDITDGMSIAKMLQDDDIEKLPVHPAYIGGSLLYEVEGAYDNVILGLTTMNSQQIADAVNQIFLSVNMSGMPPAQQKAYVNGLEGIIQEHEKYIKNALSGGEAIWNTKYHFLPTFDEKQLLNPIGDIKGQRVSTINTETFMINVRLLMGGMGLDPSMVGWADMLTGGIGEGGAFQTSAQIMRRSMGIRQGSAEFINQLMALHWGYKYNEYFENPLDYPWKVEFYSDQSAAATEQISNRQSLMNTLLLKNQVIITMKEAGLNEENTARLLERDGGMDYDEAVSLARDIVSQREVQENQRFGDE